MRFPSNLVARLDKFRASFSDSDFRAAARTTDDAVEINFHGVVGDGWEGLDSMSIASFLADHRDRPVSVSINSPGGLAFDGIAICNAFIDHPMPVVGTIDGIAASAASIIAMGCDSLAMKANASFMLHRSWAGAVGNQYVLADYIQTQKVIDDALIATYAARSGVSIAKITELIDGDALDGTYLSAAEALDIGLIDSVIPIEKKSKARASAKPAAAQAHHIVTGEAERLRKQKIANAVAVRAALVKIDLT